MSEQEIVADFAIAMYQKIEERHGRYAPLGWKTMDIKRILMLLKEEIKEFEEDGSDRAGEAIDIANYACFLWEMTRK